MRTVSGLYDNYDDAQEAVRQLESAGVSSADISIIANNSDNWYRDGTPEAVNDDRSDAAEDAGTGAEIGAVVGGVGGLLTGLGLMAIPGVGPVVAAGWLAATAVGAVGGAVVGGATGGIIGALTESGVPERDAHVYAEGVRRGGTLVTARVNDDLAAAAQQILGQSNSVDLAARRRNYEAEGWTGFDPSAPSYTIDRVRRAP